MKSIALALGTLAATAAPVVLAQQYIEVPAPHTERGYVYVPVNPSNPVGPVNPDAVVSDPYWTGRREHGLNDGTYYLQLEFRLNEGMVVFAHDSILTMEVIDDVSVRGSQHCAWPGAVRPNLHWTTDLIEPPSGRTA